MITPAGVILNLAGSGTAGFIEGLGTSAAFNHPTGIAFQRGGSVIFVADTSNHRIRMVTMTGVVFTLAGTG